MIAEGFSVRKHQAWNYLYAASAREAEIFHGALMFFNSSLLYSSPLCFTNLFYSSLEYDSTLLLSTLR